MPAATIPKYFVLGSMSDMQRKCITSVGKNVQSGKLRSGQLFSQETFNTVKVSKSRKRRSVKLRSEKRRGADLNFFLKEPKLFQVQQREAPVDQD